jgi:outer membrane lipoprotein
LWNTYFTPFTTALARFNILRKRYSSNFGSEMELEKMQIIGRSFSLLLFFLLLSGCAPAISPKLMAKVDSSLLFRKVFQNPDAYKGKTVLWGGQIIQVLPQNGTTLIEVLQMPLSLRGKPEEAFASEGKFLIMIKEYLELSRFDKGEKITIAGEIQGALKGEEIKSLGEKDYRYPLILSGEIHLWKDYLYPYSGPQPYPGPDWYDPTQRGFRF